jgi:hypothetical protein
MKSTALNKRSIVGAKKKKQVKRSGIVISSGAYAHRFRVQFCSFRVPFSAFGVQKELKAASSGGSRIFIGKTELPQPIA